MWERSLAVAAAHWLPKPMSKASTSCTSQTSDMRPQTTAASWTCLPNVPAKLGAGRFATQNSCYFPRRAVPTGPWPPSCLPNFPSNIKYLARLAGSFEQVIKGAHNAVACQLQGQLRLPSNMKYARTCWHHLPPTTCPTHTHMHT